MLYNYTGPLDFRFSCCSHQPGSFPFTCSLLFPQASCSYSPIHSFPLFFSVALHKATLTPLFPPPLLTAFPDQHSNIDSADLALVLIPVQYCSTYSHRPESFSKLSSRQAATPLPPYRHNSLLLLFYVCIQDSRTALQRTPTVPTFDTS